MDKGDILRFLQEDNMETDCSQIHQPCSSILRDIQVSLCDESMKRSSGQADEIADKKSKKKRRSSLSSHRRSITGYIIPTFHSEPESGSQGSSESSSQKTSDDGQPAQTTSSDEQRSGLPNPINLQMDAIIGKMKHQIAALDKEYEQWGCLFATSEEKEEASKQLALNLNLPVKDIPTDVKELGMSEYITSKPLDLRSVNSRLEDLLLQYKFDKEACLHSLQLIKETVETVRSTNKFISSNFFHITEEVINADTDNQETGAGIADSRQTILNYQDSA